jgi:hypothetical protein
LYSVEIPAGRDYFDRRSFFSGLPGDWWGSKLNIYIALNEAGTVQVD